MIRETTAVGYGGSLVSTVLSLSLESENDLHRKLLKIIISNFQVKIMTKYACVAHANVIHYKTSTKTIGGVL